MPESASDQLLQASGAGSVLDLHNVETLTHRMNPGSRFNINALADGSHRVAGDVAIAAVNEAFSTHLPEAEFDTIGGLVAHEHGHVPRRGEVVALPGLRLAVMLTRGGAVRWFRVERAAQVAGNSDAAEVD